MTTPIDSVAVIGVGNVGRSWAVVFARAGLRVRLWDADPAAIARAQPLIGEALAEMPTAALARITAHASLAEALAGALWVQESVAERLEVKQALFAEMDALADPQAILASSTSAIPGSQFMAALPGAARCLVAHPVNPPHLIPLVELCGTPATAADTLARADALMAAVGQSPVQLAHEVEGFLLNRLQWALMGEALHLVGEGLCSPADIDRVMTDGLARRWSFIGPFMVAHLNASAGVRGYYAGLAEAIGRVQASLRTDYPPSPALVDRLAEALEAQVPVDEIAARQAWRDKMLLARRAPKAPTR
ncbi:MAG: 3-hydroxyacyl-CoA dehydrogenase [Polymorphobacter sp.]|uniref:3-hydroxyacyl-CoA dehydrogenase n=1 Tax=Polymorphobacter sp. TaxID=1909290 RepID=UPI003A8927FC